MESEKKNTYFILAFRSTPKDEEELEEIEDRFNNHFKKNYGCFNYYFFLPIISYYVKSKLYNHIEIAFPIENRPDIVFSYSVFQDNGVYRDERSYTNSNYFFMYFRISLKNRNKMIKFLDRQYFKQKNWDYNGAKKSVIFPIVNEDFDDNWWCTSLVFRAIQIGGFLTEYNPYAMETDDIYYMLKHDKRRILKGVIMPNEYKTFDNFFN
jgi:hypothetical protein